MPFVYESSYSIDLMELKRLTEALSLYAFDCGDEDLNGFLLEDALPSAQKHIANTFVLCDEGRIVAYFCLLTDKITKLETTNADWRRFRKQFPHGKQFSSYPSVKIGRFAVSQDYRKGGVGTNLMNWIKLQLLQTITLPAYRFLTVDAYLSAIPFYEKNGFRQLQPLDDNKDTRLMFFDMLTVTE